MIEGVCLCFVVSVCGAWGCLIPSFAILTFKATLYEKHAFMTAFHIKSIHSHIVGHFKWCCTLRLLDFACSFACLMKG